MARSIYFLAFLTSLLFIALWIIKARFNGKHSFFPLDLPERPQKIIKSRFGERMKEKIRTSKTKRAKANARHQRQDDTFTSAAFPPFSNAGDVIAPHVHTRYTPESTSLKATIENTTSSPIHGLTPRLRKAASCLKLSKSGTGKDRSPLQIVGEDNSSVFSAPTIPQLAPATINRKPVATGQNTPQHDSLVERFEWLRLPPETTSHSGPAPALLSPRHLTSVSLAQLQEDQGTWDKMATTSQAQSDVTAPSFSPYTQQGIMQRPQIPSQVERRIDHTTMAEVQGESDDTSQSTEPDTNPYRQRIQARKRTLSSLRPMDAPTVRSRRRRTRSPSVSSRASDVNMTPVSSQEVSYPDLSSVVAEVRPESPSSSEHNSPRFLVSTDASLLQIELDRRLAQRLQQEEEDQNSAAELLWEQLMNAAHDLPLQRLGGSAGRGRSGPDAFIQTGSRDDPISLDSDSDSSSGDCEEVIFAGRRWFRADQVDSDPMLLDDDDSAWESYTDFDATQADIDANLARKLQDEENLNQSATSSTRECAVCGEQQPISELPSLADCEHAPQTCAECYADWVTAQLEESSWKEAKCPESKCKTTLTYHEIQGIATQDIFQRYDTYITRAAISEDPNFRWCRACDAGQEHLSGEDGNIFTCHACGHKICIKHENTWHEDETCEEYDYRSSGQKERDQKAQEEASLAAIGKLSKKCPGPKCVYNIEKNDGCDHMTCSKCRYEFCWVCLSEYNKIRRQGNSAHKRDCKYYM